MTTPDRTNGRKESSGYQWDGPNPRSVVYAQVFF